MIMTVLREHMEVHYIRARRPAVVLLGRRGSNVLRKDLRRAGPIEKDKVRGHSARVPVNCIRAKQQGRASGSCLPLPIAYRL